MMVAQKTDQQSSQHSGFMMQFLNYTIDLNQRTVSQDGQALKITAKSYDLLLLFLHNPGEVLDKQLIMTEVWPNQVISETTLYKQISRLKDEMRFTEQPNEVIKTVRNRGFVFTAPVHSAADMDSDQAPHAPPTNPWRWRISLGMLAIIGLGLLTHQIILNRQSTAKLQDTIDSLTITYQQFQIIQPEVASQAFAQALRSQLMVDGRWRTQLKAVDKPPDQASIKVLEQLNEDHLLHVDFIPHDQGIKAKALLLRNDHLLTSDFFQTATMEQMVHQIGQWLGHKLHSGDGGFLPRMTESATAFDLYLRALTLNFEQQTEAAIALLQRAIDLDPAFAIASHQLAEIYRKTGQVKQALDILLKIDLASASNRLSFMVLNNMATCHYRLGQLHEAVKLYDQAIGHAKVLEENSYLTASLVNQSFMLVDLKQFDQAKSNLNEALLYIDKEHQQMQLGSIHSSLASIAQGEHQYQHALNYAEQSEQAFAAAGSQQNVHIAINKKADILRDMAAFEPAHQAYRQVLDFSIKEDEWVNRLYALKSLAAIDTQFGRMASARIFLDQLKQALQQVDNGEVMADYLVLEARFHLVKGNTHSAAQFIDRLETHLSTLQNPGLQVDWFEVKIDHMLATGHAEQALEFWQQNQTTWDHVPMVQIQYGKILAALEQPEKALSVWSATADELRSSGPPILLNHVLCSQLAATLTQPNLTSLQTQIKAELASRQAPPCPPITAAQ